MSNYLSRTTTSSFLLNKGRTNSRINPSSLNTKSRITLRCSSLYRYSSISNSSSSSNQSIGMQSSPSGILRQQLVNNKQHQYHSITNVKKNVHSHGSSSSSKVGNMLLLASCAIGSIFLTTTDKSHRTLNEAPNEEDDGETTTVLNWSGTHSITPKHYYEPETMDELEEIMEHCNTHKIKIRPVGSALSPNGISFCKDGMLSLIHLDKVLEVDAENMTVRVQAGARVSQVLEELKKYNLTLPNLASIAEQQMGGIIQVGAHGTGASIAPIDEFVTELKILTPTKGHMTINSSNNLILFNLCKVGLGSLGVVTEVTMKCIPSHYLQEHTFVLTREEAAKQRDRLLRLHKHVRYMWIPYEDAVVVVTNDPIPVPGTIVSQKAHGSGSISPVQIYPAGPASNDREKFQPFVELLQELYPDKQQLQSVHDINSMGFGEFRDAVLHAPSTNPLDTNHIKKCNAAEAKFWKNNQGYKHKPSEELLQFDCGGQQWVYEVCFHTGSYNENNENDITFMTKLLEDIERNEVPAPAPIEQRWSSSSSSYMSPAYSDYPTDLFSWVGIIMYLPIDDGTTDGKEQSEVQKRRNVITSTFRDNYCKLLNDFGYESPYNIVSHWAKIELPQEDDNDALTRLKRVVKDKYHYLGVFNTIKEVLDPNGLLSNHVIDTLFDTDDDAKSSDSSTVTTAGEPTSTTVEEEKKEE